MPEDEEEVFIICKVHVQSYGKKKEEMLHFLLKENICSTPLLPTPNIDHYLPDHCTNDFFLTAAKILYSGVSAMLAVT